MDEAKLIRRLSAAAGVGAPPSALIGLLLGALLIALIFLLGALLWSGPQAAVYGRVIGFLYNNSKYNPNPSVRVQLEDGQVLVVGASPNCNLGDEIELVRRKALFGYAYRASFRGCGLAASEPDSTTVMKPYLPH